MSLFHRTLSTLRGLFFVTGERLESDRPEFEPLFRLPPDGVPTQPPIAGSTQSLTAHLL